MELGEVFSAETDRIIDGGLNRITTSFVCTQLSKLNNDRYKVVGLSFQPSVPANVDLYINSDKDDYLLTDDLTTTEAREYIVVINTGVKICATTTANAAFRQGTFFAGATLKIINLGQILGMGGAGGTGGDMGAYPTCTVGTPGNGSDGGDALSITTDATVDNTFGNIFSGGGGASGALATICFFDVVEFSVGGKGGGGGQGCNTSSGGTGGTGNTSTGPTGDTGSISGPGATGVTGGEWGQDGDFEGAAAGGSAGLAIDENGNTATITGGNNSAQIKGAVA